MVETQKHKNILGGKRLGLLRYRRSNFLAILGDIQATLLLTDEEMAERLHIHRVVWNDIRHHRRQFGSKVVKGALRAFPEAMTNLKFP